MKKLMVIAVVILVLLSGCASGPVVADKNMFALSDGSRLSEILIDGYDWELMSEKAQTAYLQACRELFYIFLEHKLRSELKGELRKEAIEQLSFRYLDGFEGALLSEIANAITVGYRKAPEEKELKVIVFAVHLAERFMKK